MSCKGLSYTYMLTWLDLETLLHAGKLLKWLPPGLDKVSPGGRALYMTPIVHSEVCHGNWFAPLGELPIVTRQRKQVLRAVLGRYVKGHFLNINWDIKELGTKRVDATMRGYWEFRSQPPQEETRLFGFVPLVGAFVCTDFQPRGKFLTQADWLAQRQSCQSVWDSLTCHAAFLDNPWPVRTRTDLATYL